MTRGLLIDEDARAGAARVIAYAKEHPYRISITPVPGDVPEHVLHLQVGYRVVFSFTRSLEGDLLRHLSVSVSGPNFPNPYAVWMICELFGFTGYDFARDGERPPFNWLVHADTDHNCIVVVEIMERGKQ